MNRRGFTLVEIMIVVAIIALLAAIAIPNLLRARQTSAEAAAQATLRTISTACETYAAANNGNYPDLIADLTSPTPPYLNTNYFTGTHNSYTFVGDATITTIAYTVTATPVGGLPNARLFTISTGGVLR